MAFSVELEGAALVQKRMLAVCCSMMMLMMMILLFVRLFVFVSTLAYKKKQSRTKKSPENIHKKYLSNLHNIY